MISEVCLLIPAAAAGNDRFRAYASLTFGSPPAFKAVDIRIVHAVSRLIVVMPSRPHYHDCPACRHSVCNADYYCSHCGVKLQAVPVGERHKDHRDVFCPVSPVARKALDGVILQAFSHEDSECRASNAYHHRWVKYPVAFTEFPHGEFVLGERQFVKPVD